MFVRHQYLNPILPAVRNASPKATAADRILIGILKYAPQKLAIGGV